jgi:ADP-ribosylglycohydrolase
MQRVRLSLDGLSVGDAFGGQFFIPWVFRPHFAARTPPPGPWGYTDDTEMALAIVEVLDRYGCIEQYELAHLFGRRYAANIYRGYGAGAHKLLSAVNNGTPWRNASYAAFKGQGSMGNGGAMRVAPLGAYFAGVLTTVAAQASASAEVTHAHPEGRAGAVAVAIAAAWAWENKERSGGANGQLLACALEHTPPGETRDGIAHALALPPDAPVEYAASLLGNGGLVTAPDTVPLTLWIADRHRDDFAAAMWTTVSAGGDVDTTCAIVGGIVALSAGDTIPSEWLANREPLK